MEYRRFDNTIIVRIDRGEEITEKVKEVALKENIRLASISALGAVCSMTVGIYDLNEKKFIPNDFEGMFEIVSLTGTINTMNGEYYSHLHMAAGDRNGNVFGGHLSRAVISATCEMVITVIDGMVDRKKDEETGLNLFEF